MNGGEKWTGILYAMKHVLILGILVLFVYTSVDNVAVATAYRVAATVMPQAVLPSQVQLAVIDVEMVPSPLPATAPTTTTVTSEELYVKLRVRYTGPDMLRFSPDDIGLVDSSGKWHDPKSYDSAGKLTSATLIAPAPGRYAEQSGWLHYTVPIGVATIMKMVYEHTEQTPQGTPITVKLGDRMVSNPPHATLYRVYATATRPYLRAYLLDEALAGGQVSLDVASLYADGADHTVPGAVLMSLRRQLGKLAPDRRAFDVVPAPDAAAQSERAQANAAFVAIEKDLVVVGTLHTQARWVAWYAQFIIDNNTLAALYDTWPAV